MERQENIRVITLTDLWSVLVRHLIPILLAAVICVAALFSYSNLLVTPTYSSTSTLYLLKQENSNDYVYTQSDFSLALNIVNDCTYMVKSHEVLDSVINKLDLDMSYKKLYNCVSINNPDNTRILEVTVETTDAQQSKEIADEICRVAASKINDTMGVDQVNLYSKGTVSVNPSNTISATVYALVGITAAVIAYAVFLIAFVLDDKIKSEEDVVKYLGLSVLGEIPNSNSTKNKNGKYKGYYTYGSKNTKGGTAK